jgi:hypothetical protein
MDVASASRNLFNLGRFHRIRIIGCPRESSMRPRLQRHSAARSLDKLSTPQFHIFALRIVHAPLFDHVEISVAAGIRPDSGQVLGKKKKSQEVGENARAEEMLFMNRTYLPVPVIACWIMIHQTMFEPLRTQKPVHLEIIDQKASHNLPPAVAHPSGKSELAHVGVDERHARFASAPLVKVLALALPLSHAPRVATNSTRPEHFWPDAKSKESKIIAPQELENQPVGGLVCLSFTNIKKEILASLGERT